MSHNNGNVLTPVLIIYLIFTTALSVFFSYLNQRLIKNQEATQNQIKKTDITKDQNNPATDTNNVNPCHISGDIDVRQFLTEYTVKKGDTLLSVANSQLNDPSRVGEIADLNKYLGRYPNMSLENPFIEVGWKLFLPPKNSPPNTGHLQAYGGKITAISQAFTVSFGRGGGGGNVSPDKETKFLFKNQSDYKIGDCVTFIEDVPQSYHIVKTLFIFPTDQDAFAYFKK